MRFTPLGSQGLEVPVIGLGCMGMSEFYGATNESESLAVLNRALELGCQFWDTADMYGPFTNEALLGRAIKGRRDQVIVATKFGISRNEDGSYNGIRGDADYVRASCEASLRRLGVDHIDLYYQHRVDPEVPIEETVGAMGDLITAGKVKYIGLSEADAKTIERAHATAPVSALQTEYSLWSRDVETDILPIIHQLGIGLVAYSPLGRGFLAGGIQSRDDLEPGDWRLANPRFSEDAIVSNALLANKVQEISARIGATAAQVALAWLFDRYDRLSVIPGTKRVARLEENVAAASLVLPPKERSALDALAQLKVAGTRY